MKKNISINISGIIFHIEEDGYEALRKYLDSINRYFASFEDSSEIISDIESRIAEIFFSKLSEGKQVITGEDVKSLMVTMGSVTDFKAAEEETAEAAAGNTSSQAKAEQQEARRESTTSSHAPKRMQRDSKRKVLGGVCAGLAHYFNIDPVWPRVLFALLVLGSYGGLIVAYIILWIVIPESHELEEQPSVKKMYRDRESKVLGGVAAGLAAFTGTDTAIIRLLFVITGFFGFGIVLYIVFWIALPEAKTITEKMEMQGEPVTLSNIESSVKKGINEPEGQEESTLARILLFPFRAIATILNGIAGAIGPLFKVLVDVLRVGVGAFITFLGLVFMLATLFAFGVMAGVLTSAKFPESWHVQFFSIPMEALQNSFPTWTVIFAFIAAFVPALVIFLLGVSAIAKRIVFGSTMGWTLFGLFFFSAAWLSFSIPQIALSFKEEGEVKTERVFALAIGTPVLRMNETGMDDYDDPNITLHGYSGKDVKIVQRIEAQGSNRKVAAENAQMVDYKVVQKDSAFLFDSNITFKPKAVFRAQRLRLDVYIPNGTTFIIEDALWRLLNNNSQRHDNQTETWKFEKDILKCVTCPNYDSEIEVIETPNSPPKLSLTDQYGLEGFKGVELSGIMNVTIQQGEKFAIDMGTDTKLRERYDVYMDGTTLVISYDDKRKFFWNNKFWGDADEIKIKITMPALSDLSVTGAGKVNLSGFDEMEMDIDLMGAIEADGDFNAQTLNIDITGASILDMRGNGNLLEANITGASSLKAYGFEVDHAIIEAHGASTAKVNVTGQLEMSRGIASSISYRGNPEVIKRDN
jgi:phage shock protein PspC (stress-responsive transcriptional regulator)